MPRPWSVDDNRQPRHAISRHTGVAGTLATRATRFFATTSPQLLVVLFASAAAQELTMRRLSATARRSLCTLPSQYDALPGLRRDKNQRILATKLDELRQQLSVHSRHTAAYAEAARDWHEKMAAYEARREAERARQAERWRQLPFWRRAFAQLMGHAPPPEVLLEQQMSASAAAAAPAPTSTEPASMPVPRLLRHHADADHESGGCGKADCASTSGGCASHGGEGAPSVDAPPPPMPPPVMEAGGCGKENCSSTGGGGEAQVAGGGDPTNHDAADGRRSVRHAAPRPARAQPGRRHCSGRAASARRR